MFRYLKKSALQSRATFLRVSDLRRKPRLFHLRNRIGVVFPDQRIYFNRIAKNANTYTYFTLKNVLNKGMDQQDVNEVRSSLISPVDLTLGEMFCFSRYRSVIVIRDPFHRALSGFLHKVAPGENKIFRSYQGFGNPTAGGFVEFLKDVQEQSPYSRNHHFWRQVDFQLFPDIEDYDYVIRFESLQQGLQHFLGDLGIDWSPGEKSDKDYFDSDQGKKTSATSKLEKFYTQEAAEIVRNVYAADFDTYRYDRELRHL